VSSQALSFFTIDRGTASTAVALVAPSQSRFRLLAAGVAPRGVEVEALLADLVARVEAAESGSLPRAGGWRDWVRLEAATRYPPRVLTAATSERVANDLERTLTGAGWEVAGRLGGSRLDPVAATELCLDATVAAIAVALHDPTGGDERHAMQRLAPLVRGAVIRRPDLVVLLCGPNPVLQGNLPADRAVGLPAPESVAVTAESPLRKALQTLAQARFDDDAPDGTPGRDSLLAAIHRGGLGPDVLPDARLGLRNAVETLADLLDRRVEAVEVGHGAGSRTLANPGGVEAHLSAADGALVPARAIREDRDVDAIGRWSAIRSDPFTLADRFRNLRLAPWRDVGGEGSRLRLAALRAALARLDQLWRAGVAGGREGTHPAAGDLLVCSGGPFAAVPPPAAALAIVDAMRRPGAISLFHDHARVLGPLGTLPEPGDRRRLLADLLDDALLPLGSAIVAGDLRPGARHAATLRVTSELQQHEIELAPGALRLVDLPPGIPARIEVETREGTLLGVKARKLALDVTGGLGGLLVDTREVPLKLPERAERRRAVLEAWERPVWAAAGP
jgi:hypothetical protein